jgi:V/A-type H+-transporting ATPase subunit E
MSKLGDILLEEARAEIDDILADGDTRARAIVREAQEKASARLAAHRKKTEAEGRAATRRAESAAELVISTGRMKARGHMLDKVRERALTALEETAGKPNYGEVLQALAEEAMNAVEAAEAVVVHPNDKTRLRGWAMGKGFELKTDPRLRLGVRIMASGGKRSVENSLPERLLRAWDRLSPRVARMLWE